MGMLSRRKKDGARARGWELLWDLVAGFGYYISSFLFIVFFFFFLIFPQPTSNFLRLRMPRASLREMLPLNFQLLSITAQRQSTSRTSLSLGLGISWPFMGKVFWDHSAGEAGSHMQETSPAMVMWAGPVARAVHGAGGWMGWCGEAVHMPAGVEAVWDGLRAGRAAGGDNAGYPLNPNWKILYATQQASGEHLLPLPAWMRDQRIASVIKSHASCWDHLSSWLHCPTTTPIFAEICTEAELSPAFVCDHTGL